MQVIEQPDKSDDSSTKALDGLCGDNDGHEAGFWFSCHKADLATIGESTKEEYSEADAMYKVTCIEYTKWQSVWDF